VNSRFASLGPCAVKLHCVRRETAKTCRWPAHSERLLCRQNGQRSTAVAMQHVPAILDPRLSSVHRYFFSEHPVAGFYVGAVAIHLSLTFRHNVDFTEFSSGSTKKVTNEVRHRVTDVV
jgi:hypothetical protein